MKNETNKIERIKSIILEDRYTVTVTECLIHDPYDVEFRPNRYFTFDDRDQAIEQVHKELESATDEWTKIGALPVNNVTEAPDDVEYYAEVCMVDKDNIVQAIYRIELRKAE